MTTQEVGERLCALIQQKENLKAVDELYAEDAVSVEPKEEPGMMPRVTEGKEAVRDKTIWFFDNHDIHKSTAEGPLMHGDDKFAVIMEMDVTFKPRDQNFKMKEVGVYTVKDGKIVKDEFYFTM